MSALKKFFFITKDLLKKIELCMHCIKNIEMTGIKTKRVKHGGDKVSFRFACFAAINVSPSSAYDGVINLIIMSY